MANRFEFLSKDGNITPEKARKSRQMQFREQTAYVWGLRYGWDPSLSMRSFAIDEPGSPVRALYATLLWGYQYLRRNDVNCELWQWLSFVLFWRFFYHYDVITTAAPNIQPFSFLFVSPLPTTLTHCEGRKGFSGKSWGKGEGWRGGGGGQRGRWRTGW